MWARNNNGSLEIIQFDPAGRWADNIPFIPVPERLQPWIDESWHIDDEGQFQPPTLDNPRAKLKAQATERRWQVETGGITLPNGIRIATGKDDQERVNAVLSNMERYQLAGVDFKAKSGWAHLTYPELQAIGEAIVTHVQSCFSAERAHHEAIDGLDSLEAILDYDVNAGWPG